MQKVIQRTAMAKRQAARKAEKVAQLDKAFDKKQIRREQQQLNRMANADIVAARQRRREDYMLGPLAPRRDVGEWREKYGTVASQRMQLPDADPDRKLEFQPFADGDRVVILKGREKGKIGEVRDVDEDSMSLRVKGLNLADVYLPEYMRQHEGDTTVTRTVELKIPMSDVRLVVALPDPKTGLKRDVILHDVRRRKTDHWLDRDLRGESENNENEKPLGEYVRYVPGTDIKLPYPDYEKPPPEDMAADTLRIVSEEQTWVPTLLRPPMPPTVLDELRNKYSYFRTRHSPEFVARKRAEDEAVRAEELLAKRMITPLKELHARQRAANRAKGRQPLPTEALVKIGETIAAHRAAKKAERTAAVHA